MKFARILVWINCWLFVAFGLGFILIPGPLASLVTGAIPTTTSAVIDMRATYGGVVLGLAVMFGLCARKEAHILIGLQGVLAVMTGLATSRTLGIIIDGSPNHIMFVQLASEIVIAVLALAVLRVAGGKTASKMQLEPSR